MEWEDDFGTWLVVIFIILFAVAFLWFSGLILGGLFLVVPILIDFIVDTFWHGFNFWSV